MILLPVSTDKTSVDFPFHYVFAFVYNFVYKNIADKHFSIEFNYLIFKEDTLHCS